MNIHIDFGTFSQTHTHITNLKELEYTLNEIKKRAEKEGLR